MRFLLIFSFFFFVIPAYGNNAWIEFSPESSSGFSLGQGFNGWQLGNSNLNMQLGTSNGAVLGLIPASIPSAMSAPTIGSIVPNIQSSGLAGNLQNNKMNFSPEDILSSGILSLGGGRGEGAGNAANANLMKALPNILATGLGNSSQGSAIGALLGTGIGTETGSDSSQVEALLGLMSETETGTDSFDAKAFISIPSIASGGTNPANSINIDELIKAAQDGDMSALQGIVNQQQNQTFSGNPSYNFDMLSPEQIVTQTTNSTVQGLSDIPSQTGIQTNPEIQTEMGLLYAQGEVFPKDMLKASQWYEKAADQGDARGQYLLAGLYAVGEGVEKNTQKALTLYNLAAGQGLVEAQLDLGLFHLLEKGVYHNKDLAVVWLSEAANQGNLQAVAILNDLILQEDFFAGEDKNGLSLQGSGQGSGQNSVQNPVQNSSGLTGSELDSNAKLGEGTAVNIKNNENDSTKNNTQENTIQSSEEYSKQVDPLEGINPTFLLERGFGTIEPEN